MGLPPLVGRLPRDFLLLWSGQSVSIFGSQLTRIALPTTAILTLAATPLQIATISLLAYVGLLVFGLPSGVWLDRWNRRHVMLLCDAGRTATIGSIPLAFLLGQLSIVHFYGVALVNGILDVFFAVACQSFVASVVPREELVRANARLELSNATASMAGPAAAGALLAVAAGPLVLALDAASYVASVTSLLPISSGAVRRRPAPGGKLVGDLLEGVRFVVRHRVVRATTAAAMVTNLGDTMVLVVLLLYAYRVLRMSTVDVGLVFAAGSAAALAGAAVAPRLAGRAGLGPALTGSIVLTGVCWLIAPSSLFVAPALALAGALMIRGLATVIWNVSNLSLRQSVTPDHLQARVHSSIRLLSWGVVPVGATLGGALGTYLSALMGERTGLALVILTGGCVASSAVLFLLPGRLYRLRRLESDGTNSVPRPREGDDRPCAS